MNLISVNQKLNPYLEAYFRTEINETILANQKQDVKKSDLPRRQHKKTLFIEYKNKGNVGFYLEGRIEDAFREGDYKEVDAILENLIFKGYRKIKLSQELLKSIHESINSFIEKGDMEKAILLTKVSLDRGLSIEVDKENPITTEALLYSCLEKHPILGTLLFNKATSRGVKFSPELGKYKETIFQSSKIRTIFEDGNTYKLIQIFLKMKKDGIEILNDSNLVKMRVRGKLRELVQSGKIEQAMDIATICFESGFNFEQKGQFPLTTVDIIYNGNDVNPKNAAILMKSAIKQGVKLNEKQIKYTITNLGERLKSIEHTKVYAELVRTCLEHDSLTLNDPEDKTQKTYDAALAILGAPDIYRGSPDKNILETYERAYLGIQIARKVIEKKIKFDDSRTQKRMNMFIRGIKGISEQLYLLAETYEGKEKTLNGFTPSDIKKMSHNLMKEALKLAIESIDNYRLNGITINNIMSTIIEHSMPVDNNDAFMFEKLLTEAMKKKELRVGISVETLRIFANYLLEQNNDQAVLAALAVSKVVLMHAKDLNVNEKILNEISPILLPIGSEPDKQREELHLDIQRIYKRALFNSRSVYETSSNGHYANGHSNGLLGGLPEVTDDRCRFGLWTNGKLSKSA